MKDKNEKNQRMKKIVKKGAGISLCAVLAGGLAAGAFEGVNRLTGWNQASEVHAAVSEDDGLMLTKAVSESASAGKGSLDVSEIAEEAMSSVVSITTKSLQEVQDYFGMFGYGQGYSTQQEVQGSGSGIIIGKNDDELLIATNYHVVEGADTVSVYFTDGNGCEAQVKGFDEDKDLSVLSVLLDDIDKDVMADITVATIGSSDDLKVGEQVVAIGNALGYGQSVTTGIVSAKNRRMNASAGTYQSADETDSKQGVNLIQTDAAINPGNSGGALLNMNGEVVGINSAKLASTEVEGMGYAIAISDVSDILENMMNEEPREVLEDGEHGVLGIKGSTVSDEAIQVYGIPQGVFIAEVTEDGAAEDADIQENSVITEFDGKAVSGIEQLVELLQYYQPGEKVDVIVEIPDSNGYKEKTVTVTLGKDTSTEEDKDSEDETSNGEDDRSNEDESSEDRSSLYRDWEENEEDGSAAPGFFYQNWQ